MGSPGTSCAVISCLVAIVVIAVFFTFRYLQKSAETDREWERSHRLPESVIPIHYSLVLKPELNIKVFHGENHITLNITESRRNIIFHSKQLNISKAELFNSDDKNIPLKLTFEYPDNEFWVLIPDHRLEIGQYKLHLIFAGNLTGKFVGFYRSKYTAPDGTKRCRGVTTEEQLELFAPGTDLERALPRSKRKMYIFLSKCGAPGKLYILVLISNDCSEECNPRLSDDVSPMHYDIELHPDFQNGIFKGSSAVMLSCCDQKNKIILHSSGLNISEARLVNSETNEEIKISCLSFHPKNDYIIINLANYANPGKYNLTTEFTGSLNDKIIGFYRSSYHDPAGNLRQIATSKFEPTYARQAFPCFDEPSFKATYSIKLIRPSAGNYIALSNMNQAQEYPDQPGKGLTTVEFSKSVPMSTYVVCFIVCDFDYLQPVNAQQGFPVTAYARPGQANNMQHALDFAVKTINYYIDYFGIEYPLPKLDLIAIPDFVSGAMEHWGLVTFRETQVLFNDTSNSLVNLKLVYLTIAHELAHMWFGNLVTMVWWNDLWLNEGFASYMEFKGVAQSFPDWDLDTQLLIDDTHKVLALDSALSSHPIVQTVSHPDQITEIFDTITYSKGPTIIRMLEDMIGPQVFQQGVSDYLKAFAYKNAQTEDLWSALSKQSGMNISQIMSTWTYQMGYPLVRVHRSGPDNLTLTQERFLPSYNITYNENESPFQYRWQIPITYITSVNPKDVLRGWLTVYQPTADIILPMGTTWFKLNFRQFGYYRVQYEPEDWQRIVNMLLQNPETISAADRANLIDDIFSLAKAGYVSYKMALDVIQYLPKERHFVPMIVAAHKLQSLQNILSTTIVYIKFRKYVQKILEPVMTDELWSISPSDSYQERRRKIVTLELTCSLRVPSCVYKAEEIFRNWLFHNGSQPEPELRSLVYMIGMSRGGEAEWDRLWQIYLAEQEPNEKTKLRNALTAVHEPWILMRYIDLAKDESYVRSQDFIGLLNAIAENPVGTQIVWDFIRDQWSYLVKRFTLNNRALGTLIPRVTSSFNTKTKLSELTSFIKSNPEAGAGAAGRKNAVEKIENNIQWIKTHLPELTSIF